MSADWRDEQAILRDLAIAQGSVPAVSVETVSCNEKPPLVQFEEETEEQVIRQYAADGNSAVTPDFDLIQNMLDLVRDVRVNDIENAVDSEGNSEANANNRSPQKPAKHDNTKRNKNIPTEPILNQQKAYNDKKKPPVIVLHPESMFKLKCKTNVNIPNNESINVASKESQSEVNKPGVFKPSNQAQEYYNKLMAAKRQKELREETIWTRAERQMREIEEKRRNNVVD